MAKYLLIYHGGGMPQADDEKQKVMAAWGEWMKQCGDNLVDPGNPTSEAKAVSKGSVNEVKEGRVTGYSVIEAPSLDDAVKAAKMVPIVVDGTGTCDVYETFNAM